MNRRAFLKVLGFGAAAAAAPGIACQALKTPAPAVVEIGRYENVRFIETEDVMIGDYVVTSSGNDITVELLKAEVRRIATRIAGHENIELHHFPRAWADKGDPLGQCDVIAWKANAPLVGWRDRYSVGNQNFPADHIVRSAA